FPRRIIRAKCGGTGAGRRLPRRWRRILTAGLRHDELSERLWRGHPGSLRPDEERRPARGRRSGFLRAFRPGEPGRILAYASEMLPAAGLPRSFTTSKFTFWPSLRPVSPARWT